MAVDGLSRAVAGTLRDPFDVDAFWLLQFQSLTGIGGGGLITNRIRPPQVLVPKYAWEIRSAQMGSTNGAAGMSDYFMILRLDAGLANLFGYMTFALQARTAAAGATAFPAGSDVLPLLGHQLPLTNDWEIEGRADDVVNVVYTLAVVSRAIPIRAGGLVAGAGQGGGGGGRVNIQ